MVGKGGAEKALQFGNQLDVIKQNPFDRREADQVGMVLSDREKFALTFDQKVGTVKDQGREISDILASMFGSSSLKGKGGFKKS